MQTDKTVMPPLQLPRAIAQHARTEVKILHSTATAIVHIIRAGPPMRHFMNVATTIKRPRKLGSKTFEITAATRTGEIRKHCVAFVYRHAVMSVDVMLWNFLEHGLFTTLVRVP